MTKLPPLLPTQVIESHEHSIDTMLDAIFVFFNIVLVDFRYRLVLSSIGTVHSAGVLFKCNPTPANGIFSDLKPPFFSSAWQGAPRAN
jgi:hypothetical protein